MKRWVVEWRLSWWLPLSAGFSVLAGVAVTSVWLVIANSRYQALVIHTQEVRNEAYHLLTLVQGFDTAQRGYLITGEEQFLRSYLDATRDAPQVLESLRTLTSDNPVQQREIDGLRPLLEAKQATSGEIVGLRRRGDVEGAFALVRTGRNNELAEKIKASIERLLQEEAQLLGQRSAIVVANSRLLLMVTLAAPLLVILLGLATLVAVRRREKALVTAQELLRDANEDLERTVKIRTAGLREANEEIKRFAYIVSHDLRAPLVNIMGFTSELEAIRDEVVRKLCTVTAADPVRHDRARDLDVEFGEALGFIKASTTRMDRLIDAILKLSRQGYRVLAPERLDMQALVTQIADSLKAQCLGCGAQIEISPTLPPLHADRVAIEQVFTNLIENAVKYLDDERPGQVQISGFVEPDQDGATVFEVRDNGRGIAAEDRERVFNLFRRAGPQDRPGEGIGLAHVRTLVRAMEGSVACFPTHGEGTIFRVMLPQQSAAAASAY